MIDCPIYLYTPGVTPDPDPFVDDVVCGGCNCGYLQFEELLPYLQEIKDIVKQDPEDYTQFEFRLRQQILEVSRLFDMEAGVRNGYFSKAHYKTTQVFTTNGGRFIKIPEFVLGTLEVRGTDDTVIDEGLYGFENQHLIYQPCAIHIPTECACTNRSSTSWPATCYKVAAKWGKECADLAVKMAVRDYLIETYRLQDPVKMLATGIPFQVRFRKPDSWETYMRNFKQRAKFFSQWAIA